MSASQPALSSAAVPGGHSAHAAAGAKPLTPSQWGMLAFLFSEVAFFSTLIVVYISYLHRDRVNRRLRARKGARLTAITCGFSAMCYAEFATLIPMSVSRPRTRYSMSA